MDLVFDIGNSYSPKGHALIYFKDGTSDDKIYATYVIVFPLPLNFAKYVPPFLASSLAGTSAAEISCFSMPPVPEEVENYDQLANLAQLRSDDLINGGKHAPSDAGQAMQTVGELAQAYTELWTQHSAPLATQESLEPEGLAINEVMYSFYNESDRLSELSKLIVRLRFTIENDDIQGQQETEKELRTLARYIPKECEVDKLLEVAHDSSSKGTRLLKLYLDRCFGICEKDPLKVAQLDRAIIDTETAE
jgi:hypothetical protein